MRLRHLDGIDAIAPYATEPRDGSHGRPFVNIAASSRWDSSAGLKSIAASHTCIRGSGIVGPTHWQRTHRLFEGRASKQERHGRLSTARRLHANATARAVEGNLGGFCVWPDMRTENGPSAGGVPGPLCRNSGWCGPGEVGQPEFLHSGMRSAAFSRDLFWSWRALRPGLRISDSLGQHLVQLRLSLFRFARRFPLGHADYMGRY